LTLILSILLKTQAFDNDSRLYNAIEKILQEFGVVNIEQDLDTGISQRQLRRLFEFYIGDTAKTFAKVVRFQNILRAKPSSQSLRQNKLFFDVGYYDQAHFIKEFKNFYGVTPSKAFGR
jgi:transcriptional regulator GlxA family with amidase domain